MEVVKLAIKIKTQKSWVRPVKLIYDCVYANNTLMKAYIQTDINGDFYNVNAFVASVGFNALGYEVFKYVDAEKVSETEKEAIFVGGVGNVRTRLEALGIEKPAEIEYPGELQKFLNRKVWTSTLNQVVANKQYGIFIKPTQTKLFQGKLVNEFKDFIGLNYQDEVQIWCSEIINVVTEWRCFVRYGELLDVRYYKGKWDSRLNLEIVKQAIQEYTRQPRSYGLDFGVDARGKHYLIEVNDGHSLGTYGMGAISYAKFLSARWSELTDTEDLLNF